MPKKLLYNNYQIYVNVFIIILILLTVFSYKYCEEKPNIYNNKNINNKNNTPDDMVDPIEDTLTDTSNHNIPKKSSHNEKFLDWSMYNPPIDNGYTPQWWNRRRNLSFKNRVMSNINPDTLYNPLGYSNRSQAFYKQGHYPNMLLPSQVIGCGGRRLPCLGGTQETIPVINPPIEISERNIAPVNILSRSIDPDPVGVLRQVGVLYKVFGSLNEIYPLYGIKRYRNSDTWDYSTKVGKEGNFVHVKVLTKRVNNNELQTNDEVRIDGNTTKFRVTMYDNNFPQYVPYIRN